jgi:hypothetical protein
MDIAIKKNNIEDVKRLLSEGFQSKQLNENPLDLALENNNIDIINLFLDNNFKTTKRSLDLAIKTGNIGIINRIIEKMGDGQKANPTKFSLNLAIATGNIDIINRLLTLKAKVNDESLNLAIKTNNIVIIDIIFNAGGKQTETSLNIAVETNNNEIINYIISLGCKPSIETFNYAIKIKNIDILKLLISIPDIDLDNILSSGLNPNYLSNSFLTKYKFNFDIKDNILYSAIKTNLYEFVEYILSLGVKPTLFSLDIAIHYNYIDIIELIINNIIITDNDSYNKLLEIFILNKNIDISFIEKKINTDFSISVITLDSLIRYERDDILDIILKYYPEINIQKLFEFSIKEIKLNMIKYFLNKGAKITENAKHALFNNQYWFVNNADYIKTLTEIVILFLKNGLIINDELMSSLSTMNRKGFLTYKDILDKYKNNCYLKNSENLKSELEDIGINSINNIPFDKIDSIDELCDLLHNEYKIFVLDSPYPKDNTYDNDIKPNKFHSNEDEDNKCLANNTPITLQEYKNIPQDRYIIFNNRCYYIYDIIKYFMYDYGITDIKSFLISDEFNIRTLGDLVDQLTDKKYNESFRENEDDYYIEFFNQVNNFVMYLKKLMNIDYTKLT